MKLSSLSTGILVLGLFVGCGDDEGAGVTPDPSTSSSETSVAAGDAGADAEVTSASDAVTSSESAERDAAVAPEAGMSSGGDVTDAAVGSTAEATSDEMSGDAAAGDAGDGGSGGGEECSAGSATGPDVPEDECMNLAADNWCESYSATGACMQMVATRDVSIYEAFVSCLNDALADAEACDGDVDAAVGECFAAADATSCAVHVDACDAYAGCETDTVETCDQVAAKYHDSFVDFAAPYFACGYPAASAFGE